MRQKIVLAIVGPTGIGKTRWAITLAQHFKTEIISADSRQFYKELHIGTAVPSEEELAAAKHHFIQHRSIHQPYTVGDFERDALQFLENYFQKHDIVILVGGSGLYIDAIIKGLDHFPKIDPSIRQKLQLQLEEEGLKSLQQELKKLDPQHYDRIDLNNSHRVLRALEVCKSSKKPYSSFLGQNTANRFFKTIYLGLTADRETIYERINLRVDQMVREGLVEEARSLYPHRELNALQTVGYRELFPYFEGKTNLDVAIAEIKKNTRRFAKRQLTWYRKNEAIFWMPHTSSDATLIKKVEERLKTISHA